MRNSFFIVFLYLMVIQCGNPTGHREIEEERQVYEALIQDNYNNFIHHAWNQQELDSMKSLMSGNYSWNLNGIEVAGNQGEMEAIMKLYFSGFPDGQVRLGRTMVKDERLVTQWVYKGTNTGVYSEKPPTGKRVQVSGFTEALFDTTGRIVREEVFYNELELLQQLGYTLIPPNLD